MPSQKKKLHEINKKRYYFGIDMFKAKKKKEVMTCS